MRYMNVTYKHLRLFVEEERAGWVAYVYDLDQIQFVHEGHVVHATAEEAQGEAQSKADLILGEKTAIEWSGNPSMKAHG